MDMKLSLPPFTPPVSLYHCSDVIPIHHHITLSLNERCESGERWKWRPDIQAVGKRLGEREYEYEWETMVEERWRPKRDGWQSERIAEREYVIFLSHIWCAYIISLIKICISILEKMLLGLAYQWDHIEIEIRTQIPLRTDMNSYHFS
jgi:hypothetical protein